MEHSRHCKEKTQSELRRKMKEENHDCIWIMEPEISSEFLDHLVVGLGFRYSFSSSAFNLAGGFALFVKYGFYIQVLEQSDRLLAV